MNQQSEQVVLLGEDGTPIGEADKYEVHTADTPLHLAFSCYGSQDGKLLVTRRALTKQTWPGVWTNSFCGHPGPGESMEAAVRRRARQELGMQVTDIEVALPDFRYRAVDASGVVENEICPVFTAEIEGDVDPHPNEVNEIAWVSLEDLAAAVAATPFAFSPWMVTQLPQLLEHFGPSAPSVNADLPNVDLPNADPL